MFLRHTDPSSNHPQHEISIKINSIRWAQPKITARHHKQRNIFRMPPQTNGNLFTRMSINYNSSKKKGSRGFVEHNQKFTILYIVRLRRVFVSDTLWGCENSILIKSTATRRRCWSTWTDILGNKSSSKPKPPARPPLYCTKPAFFSMKICLLWKYGEYGKIL